MKPIYKQNDFGKDAIWARELRSERLMISGPDVGPNGKQIAYSNWIAWGTVYYHHYM